MNQQNLTAKLQRKEEKLKKHGITLISLVITIIILLILAGVAINLALDSDGLFSKALEASNKWNVAVADEGEKINELWNILKEVQDEFNIKKGMKTGQQEQV